MRQHVCGWIALAAALAFAPLQAQSTGGGVSKVVSINFANGQANAQTAPQFHEVPDDPGTNYGIVSVPASTWVNLSDKTVKQSNTENDISVSATVAKAYLPDSASEGTLSVPLRISYTAKNAWSWTGVAGIVPFLQAYLDDSAPGADITVTNLPFETYDLIVYFAGDHSATTNAFNPPTINGVTYSYDANGDLVEADQPFGTAGRTTAELGKNALRVDGLSGNLTIDGGANANNARGGIAAIQIIGVDKEEAEPTYVYSLNFTRGRTDNDVVPVPGTLDEYGLVPVPGSDWTNLDDANGSAEVRTAYGFEPDTPLSVSYSSATGWSHGDENMAPFLRAYLDDGGAGVTVAVSDIPFKTYDVIVYYASDNGTGFLPATINGTFYSWADGALVTGSNARFGDGSAHSLNTPVEGMNALRVNGLSGPLSINGQPGKNNEARGGIAAVQIVGHELVAPEPLYSLNINFATGNNMTVKVPETGAYGLVPVEGASWVNLETSDGNTTGVAIDKAAGFDLATSPRLSCTASSAWSYGGTGVDSFLRCYLDDGGSGASITLTDIPFTKYDVIVYCAVDGAAGEQFGPVAVNGQRYTWDGAETVATEDENALFGAVNQANAVYGVNALRIPIENPQETLRIEGAARDGTRRGGIAAVQIVCTGELRYADPARGVMSLNFADGGEGNLPTSTVATEANRAFGLAKAPWFAWTDLMKATNAEGQKVSTLFGQPTVAGWQSSTVTWSAAGTWSYKTQQVTGAEAFLTTYLDDGAPGASVKVADVPFEAYDVIIYNATDAGSSFKPVTVNEVLYTWEDGLGTVATTDREATYGPETTNGVGGCQSAVLGTNALRINGQRGDLSILGLPSKTSSGDSENLARGGIAAVQLVARQLVTVSSGTHDWASLNVGEGALIVFEAGASVTGDVTLPEDAIVDLSACAFDGEGAAVPFAGTLTVNEGTTFRLPERFTSGKIAAAVEGDYGQTLIAGRPVWLTLTEETGTFSASYLWTDQTGNHLWSEPGNWLSLLVPDASSAVVFKPSAAHPETVILDTAAVAGSVTIERSGDDQGALTITSQDGGALTVSGRMLTTGNVAVTQSADITVNGKSVMVFPSGAPQTYPYPGAFHVEGENAAYTVAEGTLAVPAKPTSMADPTDVEATACGYATVCRNATLTVGTESGATSACLSAFRVGMTWPSSDAESRKGTVRVLPTGIFEVAYQSSFASGVTLDLRGGTLRAKETAMISSVGGYAPTSPVTLAAEAGATLTLSGALSGDAGITIAGPGGVRFATGAIAEAYTGEVAVSADATVALGAGRPGLSVAEGATVNVVPTTGETAIGRIVFPTTMESVPEGAVFSVEGVTETVSAAVEDGTLVVSWPVAIPTLSDSAWWSQGSWTDWEGEGAPTSGAAILDGTGAPIKVTLDTALSGMSTVVVRGDVTLATSTAQASIPTCVTLAEGATLTVSSGFAGAWTLPEGTTLRVTDAKVSLTGLTLEGVVELAFSDAEYETMAAFGGGLVVSGDNVRVSGIPYIGDAETRLEGDNVTLAFSGTSFYTHTVLVSAGEGNALENVQNLNGELRVTAGTLTVEVLDGEQNVAPTFLGAVIGAEATLRFTGVGDGGQFPVTGEGTLDLGIFRKQLAARSDGPLPKTLRLVATAAEQEAGAIAFPVYGDATLPEGFVAEVTPAEGGIAWVPVCAVEGSYLRIRNVPGTGIAGLPTEVERRIRERVQAEGWTSAYGVEVRTQGKTFGADAPEVAGLLEGALECFDVEPGADIAASEEGEALTVFVAYEFGIEKVAVTEGGVVVTVRLDEATFKDGVSFTALNGETAIEGVSAAVAADRASVTLTIPSVSLTDTLRLSVKVSPPTSAE